MCETVQCIPDASGAQNGTEDTYWTGYILCKFTQYNVLNMQLKIQLITSIEIQKLIKLRKIII